MVELDSGQVQLPQGAVRHDVRLQGVGERDEIQPAALAARPGDAVAFHAQDALTHSVVFLADRIDSTGVAFLDSTGQRRSPPLLNEGTQWVISLEGAPPGEYPFQCPLHGGGGVLRVSADAPRD